jgi:hypothetical protein
MREDADTMTSIRRLVDVEAAEGEHGRGEGAQADGDQDRVVAGADTVAERSPARAS